MRTLGLARQLARLVGGRHHVLLNTPFAGTLRKGIAREPLIRAQVLSPRAGPVQARAFVGRALEDVRPDVLVVDTFPRGLGGELASVFGDWRGGRRVLICRCLPPAYVNGYRLAEFVREHYELVIAPGESGPFGGSVPVHGTGPFLVRDFCELPSPRRAAELLGGRPGRKVVLLVGSGTPGECREMVRLAEGLAAGSNGFSPSLRLALPLEIGRRWQGGPPAVVRHFPLIECLPAVRMVIGAAGYNTIHEAGMLGVPVLCRPRRRKYDDQAARVRPGNRFVELGDLRPRLAAEIAKPAAELKSYHNGARQAARRIARLI